MLALTQPPRIDISPDDKRRHYDHGMALPSREKAMVKVRKGVLPCNTTCRITTMNPTTQVVLGP